MTHADPADSPTIVPTGVPGLDEILGGGLGRGGLYLIEGRAGAGKTILASQMAFHRAAQGDTVVYLTVLAESHGKLIDHMRRLAFFDDQWIPSRIQMLSGYQSLLDEGLDGLLRQIFSLLTEASPPALLIIDGFRTATVFAENEKLLARFMHQLDDLVSGARCTTLLLSPLESVQPRPEHTLVDGLIEVSLETRGLRRARLLEVRKRRGSAHMQIRMSAATENMLLLQHTVIRNRLRRQMSIVKMRDNAHDHDVHEFTIYDRGFDIGPRFQPDHEDPAAAPRGSASGGQ